MNMNTGRVLYERNADAAIAPASLTKVLAMYVALDTVRTKRVNLKKPVPISRMAAAAGGSRMHLRAGQRVSLDQLLAGMAVASGNDASMAVAQYMGVSGRRFVHLMNQKAKSIGMRHSVFKTPHGLPAKGQVATARDMLTLSRSYLRAHPDALRFHKISSVSHGGVSIRNTNPLLGSVPGVDGLKTGWTVASGYNLIFTAKRNGVRLLGVVMGGATKTRRDGEARRLVEAGFTYPNDPAKVARIIAKRR